MRILVTGTSYFPEFSAGTEVYMRYVSRYLVEHGDNVRIACGGSEHQGLCSEPKWSRCDSDFEGVKVSRVIRNASRGALSDHFTREDLERYAIWKRLFEELTPEVVFTVGRGPALMGDVEQVARNAGVPVVATLIHPDQTCPKGPRLDAWGKGCMRALDAETCCACLVRSRCGVPGMHLALKALPAGKVVKWLPQSGFAGRLRTASVLPGMVNGFLQHWQELREAVSLFVAHSEAAVELLLANGVPVPKIRLSAPGLEPREGATRARRSTGPVKFGFVGRLCAEKGVRTLVKAWRLLERDFAAELHFWGNPHTGEADVVASIEALAASDQRVEFHGPFTRDQTDSIYDSIDALVVPSEWFDNCPFVISEAFAAGVPVVGSDFGGIKSMIRHKVDGLLLPMGDAQALSGCLSRLAADPQAVRNLSQNVRPPRDAGEHVRELRGFFEEARWKTTVC
jgi:glycosyltransferase involved in cell wall biosynthesis